ncbi:MAG: signal peptidase II [Alphaproteobacteria bacterium]|nr:signal peptidase II [Alphaproteobacteria bacterium]
MRRIALIAGIVLITDQLTKFVIMERLLRPVGVPETPFWSDITIEVTPFFNLIMAWNTGISFSMLSAESDLGRWLLVALQTAITAGVLWWSRSFATRLSIAGAGLIVGGAIGNIIDRVRFGAVADFFDFHVAGWHFATFNVADSCISIGVALWLLDAVIAKPHLPGTETPGTETKES